MRSAISMQYILECGCKGVWIYRHGVRIPPAKFFCEKCKSEFPPMAMETREWRASCRTMGCKWSRWAGQSEPVAREQRRHHQNTKARHIASLAYTTVREKVDVVREAYGKQFPIGIVGNPVRNAVR